MSFVTRLTGLAFGVPLLLAVHVTGATADELELVTPGQLSAATEGTYPPFSMQNEQGELDGIDVRLMREIAKRDRKSVV